MGSEVEKEALRVGHEIVWKLSSDSNASGRGLTQARLEKVDAVIDFTVPDAVVDNVRAVMSAGVPMIVGTTGWDEQRTHVEALVARAGGVLVYGGNFSIGANLLFDLVTLAAQSLDRFEEYDPYILEHHHRGKIDAPGGTARRLMRSIIEATRRKTESQVERPEGRIRSEQLHVVSLRAGAAFGQHRVGFDSEAEQLEIVHTARGRQGFAQGAILAAKWVQGKSGFINFSDVIAEEMGR